MQTEFKMIINKTYTSGTGAKRTPLRLSECGKFVEVYCEYKKGIGRLKWFWACHRLFKD